MPKSQKSRGTSPVLSRDPDLSRKPPETDGNTMRQVFENDVEQNGETTPRKRTRATALRCFRPCGLWQQPRCEAGGWLRGHPKGCEALCGCDFLRVPFVWSWCSIFVGGGLCWCIPIFTLPLRANNSTGERSAGQEGQGGRGQAARP